MSNSFNSTVGRRVVPLAIERVRVAVREREERVCLPLLQECTPAIVEATAAVLASLGVGVSDDVLGEALVRIRRDFSSMGWNSSVPCTNNDCTRAARSGGW